MPQERCDVAIIGGGGMGCSTAYFLSQLGERKHDIVVIEPDPTYTRASTALAAGGIRQQFSTPENIVMSLFGFAFLEQIGRVLAVGDERPDVGLTPTPYLRLGAVEIRSRMAHQQSLQKSFGAGTTWLEPGDIGARFPWLRLDGVACGVLGGRREGVFDPYSMLQAFRRKAAALGVRFVQAKVAAIDLGRRARARLHLSNGAVLSAHRVVNAAGPRAADVAAMAGLPLPVEALKAQSFAFEAKSPVEGCPVVLDHAGGLQLKPEGRLFVCAVPTPRAEPAEPDDFDPDPDMFERDVWPKLAARVPQFDSLRLTRTWVGHVERCLLDGNPIIGPHPDAPRFFFLNGFSGHGAQHVPAAGRAMAELLAFGAYRSIDLSRFGYERVRSGDLAPETV